VSIARLKDGGEVLGSYDLPSDLKAVRALLALECTCCRGFGVELVKGLKGLA